LIAQLITYPTDWGASSGFFGLSWVTGLPTLSAAWYGGDRSVSKSGRTGWLRWDGRGRTVARADAMPRPARKSAGEAMRPPVTVLH